MDDFGVKEKGFSRPTYPEVRDFLLDKSRDVFGPEWNLGLKSVTGLTVRAFAFGVTPLWRVLHRVWLNNFVPTAEGSSLDLAVARLDLEREGEQRATGIVTFSGNTGVEIPSGTRVTNADDPDFPVFETVQGPVTVQGRGEVDMFIEAIETGSRGNVGTGAIDQIESPVGGVDAVDNNIRSDVLDLGLDTNTTAFRSVATGEEAYQEIDVGDMLHDIRIDRVQWEVRNPDSVEQFYSLDLAIVDDSTGDVIEDLGLRNLNISGTSTATITVEDLEIDVRDFDTIRIRMINTAGSDDTLEVVADTEDNYTNGALVIGGTEQTGEDWVSDVRSSTPGETSGGLDQETDAELRQRYFDSLARAGKSTVESIRAAVLTVDGVRIASVEENTSDSTDGQGRPPKSVEVTVLGGDDQDVAQTVFDNRPSGIEDHGDETVAIFDNQDIERDVNFTRPTQVDIDVNVTIDVTEDFPADGEEQIQDNIIEYIGGTNSDNELNTGLEIGADVIHREVVRAVMEVDQINDASVIEIRRDSDAFAESNITIADTEVAETSTGRIDITIS